MQPSTILNLDTGLTKLVGVAKTNIEFVKGLMILGDLCIEIDFVDQCRIKGWELTGLNIKFEAYAPDQTLFINQTLNSS